MDPTDWDSKTESSRKAPHCLPDSPALTKPDGRPKNSRRALRRQELAARLYWMVAVNTNEVRQVLPADGFSPGSRNIQMQLRMLRSRTLTELIANRGPHRQTSFGQSQGRRGSHTKYIQSPLEHDDLGAHKYPELTTTTLPSTRSDPIFPAKEATKYRNSFSYYEQLPPIIPESSVNPNPGDSETIRNSSASHLSHDIVQLSAIQPPIDQLFFSAQDQTKPDLEALGAHRQESSIPEIDFTLHTMEDGSQVSTVERVCKDTQPPAMHPPTDQQFFSTQDQLDPYMEWLIQRFDSETEEQELHILEAGAKSFKQGLDSFSMNTLRSAPRAIQAIGLLLWESDDHREPITVCGDVHGQYHDLLQLFESGGTLAVADRLLKGWNEELGNLRGPYSHARIGKLLDRDYVWVVTQTMVSFENLTLWAVHTVLSYKVYPGFWGRAFLERYPSLVMDYTRVSVLCCIMD